MVSALVLDAGRWEPPRPFGIYADGAVFTRIVGTQHLQQVEFTTKDGEHLWLWGNGQTDQRHLTYNESATRLYQALSPVPTRQQVLGNVIITAADGDVPWSVVRLAQRLYLSRERSLTAALSSAAERGVG
jgi:hypothetical protein